MGRTWTATSSVGEASSRGRSGEIGLEGADLFFYSSATCELFE